MPVSVKIIHLKDFVCTRVDGSLDLPASREVLLGLVSTISSPGEYHVLIDTRQADLSLSVTDIYELGRAAASHPAVAHSKTALLAPLGREAEAQFLETVVQNRGGFLRAFTSFEEAITWLVVSGPD
jgi:hypothetical protein